MEINIIGIAVLTVIVIVISTTFIYSFGGELKGSIPEKIGKVFNKVRLAISPGKSYNICEAYSGKTISLKEFQTILQASYNGECGNVKSNYTLSFSLRKEDIQHLAKTSNIAKGGKLILYKKRLKPIGAGAIIINGNPGYYPLKKFDYIQVWSGGEPSRDVIINLIEEGCDPYDENCEVMCSYLNGVCDPLCYINDKAEEVPCDFDCIDYDKNGIINLSDLDGVCDLDCYNNFTDVRGAYDIDCILRNKDIYDGICDPDTNGKTDGVCDPDCAKPNYICDFDCNGTVYDGNLKGLNDTDCYSCDKICNGFCSFACKPGDDPDCIEGFEGFFNLTECCNNTKCGSGENCENCPNDCPVGATCEDLNKVCCPSSFDSDEFGCSGIRDLNATKICSCDSQCKENLTCTSHHCCPAGMFWSSSENNCTNRTDVLIVALKRNLERVYTPAQIKQLENKIKEYRESLAQDGLGSMFLYLDEDKTAEITPGGKKVTNPRSWRNIDSVLNQLIPKLNVSYLIIIGGYDRFPQIYLGRGPYGYKVHSDDRYGDEDDDEELDVSVGRFLDPNRGDLNVILQALDTYIALHNSGGLDLSSYQSSVMPRSWNSGVCFHEDVFGKSCSSDSRCIMRPDCSLKEASSKDLFTVLLHGGHGTPQVFNCKYGWECGCAGGGYRSFTPSKLRSLNVENSVWFVMSCSGGVIYNKPTTSSSIPMTFLNRGGAVYFGSACIVFGGKSSGCPVPGGDSCIGSLYTEVAKRFSVGKRIGDAYKEGKNYYLSHYFCSGGTSYTAHINCLYGDPTLKIKKKW
ncbi:MAG: hypothetical protein J7J15_01300 [Candidatus Aenigmarchaeota archaeon]|nr:hypothetical protein [Candidatus Aenigmarchaeota archaeon]